MKRIGTIATRVSVVAALVLFLTVNAGAHKPVDVSGPATREEPIVITEHWISWAAYNELEQPGEVHYYRLEGVNRGEKIHLSLLVPQLERFEKFFPVIALLGPGLENDLNDLEEEMVQEILSPKEREGVIIRQFQEGTGGSFFEPFTQTRYAERQEMNIFAPETGTYYAVVFDPTGNADKYIFAIGEEEKWGLGDILTMPRIWWDVRMFMETERSTYIATGIMATAAVLIAIWLLKK